MNKRTAPPPVVDSAPVVDSTALVAANTAKHFNAITGRQLTDDQAARFVVGAASIGLQAGQHSASTVRELTARHAAACGMEDLTGVEHELFVSLFSYETCKLGAAS